MVFDTNVLAYALLNEPEHRVAARGALAAAPSVEVPDLALPELANVVWQWVRRRGLLVDEGHSTLDLALGLVTEIVPSTSLWHAGLDVALAAEISVYDALFVALALQRGTQLVTADRRVLDAVPGVAIPPSAVTATDE